MLTYKNFTHLFRKTIKIVVVGNCQSRPLAALFRAFNPNVEISAIAVVHLLQSHQYNEYKAAFDNADFIIAQSVSDNYPCEFVRTCFLEKNYKKKLIKIINLYYIGYTPDWMYIRTIDKKPLKGPMGDYHNKTIFDSWRTNLTIKETAARIDDFSYNHQIYMHAAIESLQELQSREETIDVAITDYIANRFTQERLFFTINHPSHILLEEYARRVFNHCKIPVKNNHIAIKEEPLGQFKPRVNPATHIEFFNDQYHYGIEFSTTEAVPAGMRRKKYTSTEIAHIFYELYEINKAQI